MKLKWREQPGMEWSLSEAGEVRGVGSSGRRVLEWVGSLGQKNHSSGVSGKRERQGYFWENSNGYHPNPRRFIIFTKIP